MWPQSKVFRIASCAVFPLFLIAFAAVYLWDVYRYLNLLREDSWIEWLSFTFLMLAGLLSWDIAIQIRQREHRYDWFHIAFGLFCVLMALEEISWGQRVFSLQPAEFFLGRSDQQEINVHNVLQQQLDFKTKDVAAMVLVGYGLILPILALNSRIDGLLNRLGFVVPPLFLTVGFFLASLMMLDVPTGWEEELGEFFFALCFLLFMVHELAKHSPSGRLQPVRINSLRSGLSDSTLDRLILSTLTLMAFALRFWQLGRKGLWLGEASHVLAAQAGVGEIIRHAWQSATIEPPAWTLILHVWMLVNGSTEASLRLLPALVGALSVPLLWQILKFVAPGDRALRTIAALLMILSSGLLYFAQDVATYSFLVTLALLSLNATLQLARRPISWWLPVFVVVNWVMLSFHLYTVTLLIAETIFFIVGVIIADKDGRPSWIPFGAGVSLSFLPFLIWALFAPQFSPTLDLLRISPVGEDWTLAEHLGRLWRDLIFGSTLWQPYVAGRSYLLLPFVLLGAWVLIARAPPGDKSDREINSAAWASLLLSTVLVPLLPAAFVLMGMPSGALIALVPGLLILASMGMIYLWQTVRMIGLAGLALLLYVGVMGIVFYFGDYEKSAYREMADYVAARAQSNDGLLIETHQQHPLTRYYLGGLGTIRPIPQIDLSENWLTPAVPIVPEDVDDQIQAYLREHPSLWLILYAEKEADPNSFVRQYLTAVAHKRECTEWLDLELCHFSSPHFRQPVVRIQPKALYGGEMLLQNVSIELTSAHPADGPALLFTLDWLSVLQPSADYTVSIRLVDVGGNIVAQRDSLPIGPLLPPTTWSAGDRKPGYMALQLPDDIEPGEYAVQTILYDPVVASPLPAEFEDGGTYEGPISWALVRISDNIELLESE